MSCSVQTEFPEQFDGEVFQNTRSIKFMHRTPRFGHTSDIVMLMNESKEDGEDYIRGLLAASITIFCFFLVWLFMLLGFKCMGPNRVGWLSGSLAPFSAEPQEEDYDDAEEYKQDLEQWHKEHNRVSRRMNWIRALVVFAALLIIINSVLLCVKGVNSLVKAVDAGIGTITMVKDLLQGGIDLIDTILEEQTPPSTEIEAVLNAVDSICPEDLDPLCTNITDPITCNLDGVDVGEVVLNFITFFATARSLVYEELFQSRADLVDMLVVADELEDFGETFNWALYCSMAFSIALDVLCAFVIIGAVFQLSRITKCLQHVILVPVFVLLVILAWVFSMVFVIGSIGLADMCIDSPDDRVLILLEKFRSRFSSSIIFEFIVFYINGCPLQLVPAALVKLLEFLRFLVEANSNVNLAAISMSYDRLQNALCKSGNTANAVFLTSTASNQLCFIARSMKDIRLYFQCSNWYPLYENSMYGALCYSGTDGFAWVTTTQLIIVLMAMLILTFRIVFYDITVSEPKENEVDVDSFNKNILKNGGEQPQDQVVDEDETSADAEDKSESNNFRFPYSETNSNPPKKKHEEDAVVDEKESRE